ncbi:MAG: glycosyltransferase [Limisphaerales bacterium]
MGTRPPFFSVIIPTAGRPRQLGACLESLACIEYPRDHYEVIIVDDGSETPLAPLAGSFRDRIDVTLLSQAHSGPAAARNAGAKRARGTYLAFTDDDCMPNADWLQKLEERFVQTPEHLVGGRTLNALPNNPYSTASHLLIDYLYRHYNPILTQASFLTSNNLAVPAAQFRALGGFDAAFPLAAAEDRDFCDRWRHHGQRMIYAPEVLVYHAPPLTFRAFLRQHFRYGRGAFSFHQARARRGQSRVRLESVTFYINLLRYPASQSPCKNVWSSAALLFFSQVANAVGFFWEMGVNHRGK